MGTFKEVAIKPYSKELRGEVLAAYDRGGGTREVATPFNVSESWVRRVKQERRELNKVAPLLTRRRVALSGRGKSPPDVFPRMKTSGFRGCCAPGIASLRSSRLFIHSLLWAPLADRIQEAVAQKPDIALRELKTELQTDLSLATLCTVLQRLRLTFKKSPPKKVLLASERTRPDVAERRE